MTLSLTDGDVGSTIWPEPFRAIYIMTFAQTLSLRLAVQNRARHRIVFEEALHTYFAISDTSDIAISGLAGTTYIDKTDAARRKPQTTELVTITAETDRVYLIRQGNVSSKIAVVGAVSSSRKATQHLTPDRHPFPEQSVVVSHVFSLLQAVPGQELAPTEKGGATYKGRVYHQKPAHWHQMRAELNQGGSPPLTL